MWSCYGVHVHAYVCMALLVCILCQPVHSCIETSLHQQDLSFRNFLMETYFYSFLIKLNCYTCCPRPCVIYAHVRTDEWHSTTSTLCSLSLLRKKVQAVSPSYAQSKVQIGGTSPEIFLTMAAISNATHIALRR